MAIYTRRQAALLLVLVVAGGLGIAVGDWRRSHPGIADELERLDRAPDTDAGGPPPSSREEPPLRAHTDGTAIDAGRQARRDGRRTGHPSATDGARRAAATLGPAATRLRRGDAPAVDRPVDLNRASTGELTRLPGIGPVLADRIVASRDAAGPFASVDELRRVGGIGPGKLERVRPHAAVTPPVVHPDLTPHAPHRLPDPG